MPTGFETVLADLDPALLDLRDFVVVKCIVHVDDPRPFYLQFQRGVLHRPGTVGEAENSDVEGVRRTAIPLSQSTTSQLPILKDILALITSCLAITFQRLTTKNDLLAPSDSVQAKFLLDFDPAEDESELVHHLTLNKNTSRPVLSVLRLAHIVSCVHDFDPLYSAFDHQSFWYAMLITSLVAGSRDWVEPNTNNAAPLYAKTGYQRERVVFGTSANPKVAGTVKWMTVQDLNATVVEGVRSDEEQRWNEREVQRTIDESRRRRARVANEGPSHQDVATTTTTATSGVQVVPQGAGDR